MPQKRVKASSGESWRARIVCDSNRQSGEACIKGTRIRVSIVVASLADLSVDELLAEYPQLTRADVRAALLFAAEAAHSTLVA
ncbi:MAG: DUF433 domain-containing protein [Planctomycetes bacterium]|nr:DUF433 domain-containing protein [Planctomycetota bacterium]